ncbi:hypothetical protein OCS_03516 [Ophiocordyceps sinensis CO18]|uniref:Uncharacterized protein n=1 Tax=Ophiocordyceps sinensis (strain Co18 / CGMCC 3.14243) TaxID=911162 RepID=T5A5L7_OPHSC|nr:hypothetical protein OCS_03516 [Ophiocordyceps sinensis CO18]
MALVEVDNGGKVGQKLQAHGPRHRRRPAMDDVHERRKRLDVPVKRRHEPKGPVSEPSRRLMRLERRSEIRRCQGQVLGGKEHSDMGVPRDFAILGQIARLYEHSKTLVLTVEASVNVVGGSGVVGLFADVPRVFRVHQHQQNVPVGVDDACDAFHAWHSDRREMRARADAQRAGRDALMVSWQRLQEAEQGEVWTRPRNKQLEAL